MLSWRTKDEKLLCLKWDPRIVRENSPTLETTKDVPSDVHEMNGVLFGSEIILYDEGKE